MKTCKNCKNCKHWFTARPKTVVMPGRGICHPTGRVKGMGGVTHADEDSPAHAVATVISAFGYEMVISQLETDEDFGCNQFEEKE